MQNPHIEQKNKLKSAPSTKTSKEAYALTTIAGFIDAVGFIIFSGLFVANMSGNSAALGAWLGQGEWRHGLPHLFAVPIFVIGLIGGYTAITLNCTLRRCALLLASEAVLILLFIILQIFQDHPAPPSNTYFLTATPLLLAMGMQNAPLRQIKKSAFASTYVTGMLDTFSRSIASLICTHLKGGSAADKSSIIKSGVLWLSYIAGALLGSFSLIHLGPLVLLLPIIVLLGIAGHFFFKHPR